MSVPTTLSTTRSTSSTAFAAGGLAVAFVIIVLGNVGVRPGENGGTGPAVFTGVLCTLVTLGLFVGLVPRLGRPERVNRTVVVLGALAVVSVLVFWSGLPAVLAAAAAAAAAKLDHPSRAARTLVALGVVATLVALAATIAQSHAL